ncbi:MAG: hypothetical protein A3H70_00445 [Candidatus Komeilibacteria bacterium RIFCSPLOWO2_02_FULL_48_11]|uniref:Glycerol-3-phosphate dehydrogenase [NAD(P)+] n=1 Tax=Candidatus Komeilibacteria bacterium RIFCSPLOWO2_02_FULL_48_11 TaxID=1798553 RepID=A0A1G2BV48_9BACT|nr:MAG: hypothetical protein A3H70_00445 [Candidatus Komeilibacteria bacterium RIFCSPLOWO2_02_FULL_48_11]
MQQPTVTILGAGAMGMALATILSANGYKICFWDMDEKVVAGINQKHRNPRSFPDIKLPETVSAEADITKAVFGADMIILAVASVGMRPVCQKIEGAIGRNCVVVNIAKGLEAGSLKTMPEVITEVLAATFRDQIIAISGPTLAEEVAGKIPSAAMLASRKDNAYCQRAKAALSSNWFRLYETRDMVGVAMGGVVKHSLAIIAGISDGLKYGSDTRAWLLTEGFREVSRLVWKMGGQEETVYGLAGLGDALATCFSVESRNRQFGELLGKGKSLERALALVGQTVEGVPAVESLHKLALRERLNLPLLQALYDIIVLKKSASKIFASFVKT